MKRLVLIVAVLAVCAMPLAALADWCWCDPDPNTKFFQRPDPTGWDVRVTTPKTLADDFECKETGWITDIHFWCSWKGDIVGTIDTLYLTIYSDVPQTCPEDYSKPGKDLWSAEIDPASYSGQVTIREDDFVDQGWYDPNTQEYARHDHDILWQVNIYLDEQDWFEQRGTPDEPVIYWLGISADVSSPAGADADFGWKTSYENKAPDTAVWSDDGMSWSRLLDPCFEDPEEPLNLAFVITGIPIPEPSVFLLGGFGLLALLRLRRRK